MAPAPPASAPPGQAAAGGEVVAGPVTLQVPEGWVRKPNPAFVLAEFALPRVEGDPEDGRLTISSAGGTLDMNISRWRGQFKENPPAETTAREVNGFKATVVRLSGTLSGSGGPMARGGPDKPGQRMWGAIIEVPGQEQKVFLKATGPEKTLARWEDSLGKALGSAKRAP